MRKAEELRPAAISRRGAMNWAMAAAVAGCAPRGERGEKTGAGTLTATTGLPEPHTLFAPGGGGTGPAFTGSKVLERLARYNADQTFSPVLASGWEIAADGSAILLTLHEGVKWHDGQPFTAEDVAWSVTHYWKPFFPQTLLDFLAGVDVLDPLRLRIRFTQPVPQFSLLTLLSESTTYILPKHLYEGTDILLNPVNAAPVGTGPWTFSQWVRGSHAEFVKTPDYRIPDQPKFDRLVVRWWREPASRAAALETGQVDIAVSSPAALTDVRRLQANPELVVRIEEDAGGGGSLYFNTQRPVFSDVRVRQALLHAVDRAFIGETVYAGFGKPAISPIYSSNRLYFTDDVPKYPFDPRRAEALLDAAGYPRKADGKRFRIDLLASGWYEENGKVGAYLKQAFGDVGADVALRIPDRPNSLKALYTDYDFDVAYSQAGGTSGEPLPGLAQIYTTAGIRKGLNFRNASRYSNPQMDRLVERITVEVDAEKRKALIHEFARLAATEVPVVPLVEVTPHYIHRKDITVPVGARSLTTDSWGDISRESAG